MGLNVGKAVKSVGKSVKKATKSFVSAPFNAARAASRGDIMGVIGSAASIASMGTININNNAAGSVDDSGVDILSQEQEDLKNRRQRLFSTAGGASGQEVLSVGAPAGRGTLFGN